MNVTAISSIPRVAAPTAATYAARVPIVDDTRAAWQAERAAALRNADRITDRNTDPSAERAAALSAERQAALRQALREDAAQAAWEARRIARTRPVADTAAAQAAHRSDTDAARHADAAIDPLAAATAPVIANLDALRDQYADTRLRRAVDAYTVQAGVDPVAQRANNANDLGTIEGLTPLQPYRVAMGNAQVQELQTAVAMKAAGVGIPAVANIGATENVTDNARYRSGFAARPDA